MVDAVVFDFDGLVLDTETPIFRAWTECYERHGCEPPGLEWWTAIIGTNDPPDLLAPIQERLGEEFDAAEVNSWRRARRDELLATEDVLPGIVAWLEEAEAAGLAIGIASSSERDWVEGHLERLGLRQRFSILACFDGELAAKPQPDLYLAACEGLGVEPPAAVAVEDSVHGVTAAKAAGLRCVAVPRGMTAALDFSAADLVVPSLADVSLSEAFERLGISARS